MFFLALVSGCNNAQPGVADQPDDVADEPALYGGTWDVPDRDDLDDVDLPPGPEGDGYTLTAAPGMVLYSDPTSRTPLSAAAECGALVLACVEPEIRNVRGCLQNVEACPDDRPWESDNDLCCPSSCEATYLEARTDGLDEPDAITAALFGESPCSPGLADMRETR